MNRRFKAPLVFSTVLLTAIAGTLSAASAATFIGPTPYLQSSDGPFHSENFDYFYLEDFEDEILNTPGITATSAWRIHTGAYADSVDADDGAIDGNNTGRVGSNLLSNFSNQPLTIEFSALELGGNLPTHAGIVWTDVGINGGGDGPGSQPVIFSAVDAQGNSLGNVGPIMLGDIPITGQTTEDKFFGIVNPGGLSSITIAMPGLNNWGVDHIQYGFQSLPATSLTSPIVSASATPMPNPPELASRPTPRSAPR